MMIAAAIEAKSLFALAGGIIALWFAADWLVQGASKLAVNLNIKPVVIGLTIVALGTSAPELLVSASAALKDQADVALGNVLGSNVANIALVLGLCAFLSPIKIDNSMRKKELPMMVGISLLFYGFSALGLNLVLWEGVIFLIILICFIYRSFKTSSDDDELDEETAELVQGSKKGMNGWYAFQIVLGFVGLVYGAKFLVSGATDIARVFEINELFISLSLVAFGTSLPELAASGMAAWRDKTDLCVGNVVGSNIFNIVLVLGVAAVITPIKMKQSYLTNELLWMLGVSVFLYLLCLKVDKLTKRHGTILIAGYVAFLYFTYQG